MENKMNHFCNHIRAALACYVDMSPEQQARAMMYAAHKINSLHALHTASGTPGGISVGAGELLQKTQQFNAMDTSDGTNQKE